MTKVLVVESDPLSMELTHEILNALGLITHGAFNGNEAIKKAESDLYNLILTEIRLPEMNGIETTQIIKSMPLYKNVPVIAVTACAMKGARERIIDCGLDDYISKPIDVSDFTKSITSWVNNTRNMEE